MKAMRWILMLVFTALILAGVKPLVKKMAKLR